MMDINDLINRVRSSSKDIEELQNIDLIVVELMIRSAESIAVKENDYAAAFLEALELGYKMTMQKAEWQAKRATGGDYDAEKRRLHALEKLHTHIQSRIKTLQIIADTK